jgi:putative membrane protein insertion efficiency factor
MGKRALYQPDIGLMEKRSNMAEALRYLPRRLAVALLSAPIYAYRYLLSPVLPPSCRFAPSCSAYALEALSVHGPIKGSWLALRRLSRCHPIAFLGGSSGVDPVPPR